MIEHSPDIAELAKALHAAQGKLEGVQKDAKNPHFKNRYASLEAVVDAARPALQAHGIAFTQAPGALVNNAVEITTMLVHVSGQWMRSTLHVPLVKTDPQGVGSALTYGQRYSLMAVLGLPPVDDDGEAASRPVEPRQVQPTVNLTAIVEYGSGTKTALANCETRDEVLAWFRDEAERRRDLGITKDSKAYADIVKACEARCAEIEQPSSRKTA